MWEQIEGCFIFENLIGKSPSMQAVYDLAAKVAPTMEMIEKQLIGRALSEAKGFK